MSMSSLPSNVNDAYTDLTSLQSINTLGRKDKGKALEEVAKQFESMMVRMMMKSMRDANALFAKDNFLSSPQLDMYQQMYDDQMALTLSKGKGLGLRESMIRQLQKNFGEETTEAAPQNFSTLQRTMTSIDEAEKQPATRSNSVLGVTHTTATENVKTEKVQLDGSPVDFINKLYDVAKKAADKLDVSPAVLLAQSALETGWGNKITQDGQGNSSFNLFNIKAGSEWQGKVVSVSTLEYKDTVPVREQANFRAYDSLQQSFDDYVEFVSGRERYQKALQANSGEEYISELAAAGYATDPNYANKVLAVVNSPSMRQAIAEREVN